MDTRPDRSLPAHSRHDTLQTADKLAAIMRAQKLDDHKLPGSHTRSLSVQRQPETRERTSDGQPENRVGRFRLSATNLNSQKATLTLALSRRERGLTALSGRATPTGNTESNSDSETDQKPLTLALSRRERGLTVVFGRATPTWDTEPNSDYETDQKPLTLALSRRERGLIEVFGRATPT